MDFYLVRPEVPGGLGDGTILDRSGPNLEVSHLDFQFDSWLGDQLITSHPVFAATRQLADQFAAANLTGIRERAMEVSFSDTFDEMYEGPELPAFVELVVSGAAGVDDFGINADNDLVMSQRAVNVLRLTPMIATDIIPVA